MQNSKSLCVFCGASNNVDSKFLEMGSAFGALLAQRGINLVYGGGDCGMMGAVATAVMAHGGHATGVFPKSLRGLEKEQQGLNEIIYVDTMHQRKFTMFDRSDAFAILPGGFGTMDEMFEILTWRQVHIHEKPTVIFNFDGYWSPLIALFENILEHGFAAPVTRESFTVVDEMEGILKTLEW